jgi:nitrate reductase assembly molybdenum cofactor insertion protein NarJ
VSIDLAIPDETAAARFHQLQALEEQLQATLATIKRQQAALKDLREEYASLIDLLRKTIRDETPRPLPFPPHGE